MIRASIAGFIALAFAPLAAPAATCSGVDVAITHAGIASMSTSGSVNHYTLTATLTNLGTVAQYSNVLASVNISMYGEKLDQRGVKPLAPGESTTVTWSWQRSSEAAKGTSTIDLKYEIQSQVPAGQEECNTANDHYSLTI
jgi:CARDB